MSGNWKHLVKTLIFASFEMLNIFWTSLTQFLIFQSRNVKKGALATKRRVVFTSDAEEKAVCLLGFRTKFAHFRNFFSRFLNNFRENFWLHFRENFRENRVNIFAKIDRHLNPWTSSFQQLTNLVEVKVIYTSVIIKDFWTVTFEHTDLRFSAHSNLRWRHSAF